MTEIPLIMASNTGICPDQQRPRLSELTYARVHTRIHFCGPSYALSYSLPRLTHYHTKDIDSLVRMRLHHPLHMAVLRSRPRGAHKPLLLLHCLLGHHLLSLLRLHRRMLGLMELILGLVLNLLRLHRRCPLALTLGLGLRRPWSRDALLFGLHVHWQSVDRRGGLFLRRWGESWKERRMSGCLGLGVRRTASGVSWRLSSTLFRLVCTDFCAEMVTQLTSMLPFSLVRGQEIDVGATRDG